MSQQTCAFCDAPLTKLTGIVGQGIRRLERLIDDLVRLNSGGARRTTRSLSQRGLRYPQCLPERRDQRSRICRMRFATISDGFQRAGSGSRGTDDMAH